VVRPFAALIKVYERVFYTWGPLFGALLLAGLWGLVRQLATRAAGAAPDLRDRGHRRLGAPSMEGD